MYEQRAPATQGGAGGSWFKYSLEVTFLSEMLVVAGVLVVREMGRSGRGDSGH